MPLEPLKFCDRARFLGAKRARCADRGTGIHYVVGSPSSYLYCDAQRPVNAANCTITGCPDGFAPFAGAAACAGYNDWKYGTDALEGAAAAVAPNALKTAYLARDITYLYGALDDAATTTADYSQLDVSCAGNAQGPYRLQRGLAYYAYATALGAHSPTPLVASGCGHSPSCVFESSVGVTAVFGP